MNKNTIEVLEYNQIIQTLKSYALSDMAKEIIEKLEPYVDIKLIERHMEETTEARAIVDKSTNAPLQSLTGIDFIRDKIKKGVNLLPEELEKIAILLRDGKKLKNFMKDKLYCAPRVSTYAASIYELDDLIEEIEKSIAQGRVLDKATTTLSKIRKKIVILEERIKNKIESVLRNEKYKNYIGENLVTIRNGRYVIPVKSQYKHEIQGSIHDNSSSGSTVFIEPIEVKKAQDELNMFKIEEEKEVYKILSTLTILVESFNRELSINIETMVYYDFLFAKAKYSKALDAGPVKFNTERIVKINKGKHPLLGKSAVALDFNIGEDYKALVITGPNTGGKTVALKTVGLLTIMAQSGLHVPVEKGSEFGVFADVLVDIGDGQSIEQNLSTFSSHVKNIINIMACADKYTMAIMDEVGSGTDPGEGMGIATAVLEKVYEKGALIFATTHYSEIKEFADKKEGFKNGCMEFDINTLKPTYKLKIGKAGESNAFLIALRLGMDIKIIERAHRITYKEEKSYLGFNKDLYNVKTADKEALKNHEDKIKAIENVKKISKITEKQKQQPYFNLGDCVYISTMDRTGIVSELQNSKGEIGVMVMGKKFKINHKRLKLYVASEELYPEDYDFDIVFESKDNRKKNKLMNKRHVEGTKIQVKKGES